MQWYFIYRVYTSIGFTSTFYVFGTLTTWYILVHTSMTCSYSYLLVYPVLYQYSCFHWHPGGGNYRCSRVQPCVRQARRTKLCTKFRYQSRYVLSWYIPVIRQVYIRINHIVTGTEIVYKVWDIVTTCIRHSLSYDMIRSSIYLVYTCYI